MISKFLQSVIFVFFLLFSFYSNSQSFYKEPVYILRSSNDFESLNNKIGALYEGSRFRVLRYFPEKNAAEIEITSLAPFSFIKTDYFGPYYIHLGSEIKHIKNPNLKNEAGLSNCLECSIAASAQTILAQSNQRHLTELSNGILIKENEALAVSPEVRQSSKPPVLLSGPKQPGSLDSQIKNYSSSSEVTRMIDWALKNKRSASAGICYRKVKEAMATQCGPARANYSCKNPFYPEGGKQGPGNNLMKTVSTDIKDFAALSAKDRLKESGFVNLLEIEPYKSEMRSPSQAPKGAVLVYSSGIPCSAKDKNGKIIARTNDCGHTEIKVGNEGEPGYVSDYYSTDAINETPNARKNGTKYKLVGVMIKPMDKK